MKALAVALLFGMMMGNANGQGDAPYSVNSRGTVKSQPPPSSELFKLVNSLYLLHWAKNNVEALQGALPIHEFNERYENSTYGKWMNAIETHLQPVATAIIGVYAGRVPVESPIVEIRTEQQKRDLSAGRLSLRKKEADPNDTQVEHSPDPFVERHRLVMSVLRREGILPALISASGTDSATAETYSQWRAATEKKIGDVEKQIEKASKGPLVPGRLAGLSIDIDTYLRQEEPSTSESAGSATRTISDQCKSNLALLEAYNNPMCGDGTGDAMAIRLHQDCIASSDQTRALVQRDVRRNCGQNAETFIRANEDRRKK